MQARTIDFLKRFVRPCIHLSVWAALAVLPPLASGDPRETALRTLPGLVVMASLFYLDYLLLVPSLLMRRRWILRWLGIHLVLLVSIHAAFALVGHAVFPVPNRKFEDRRGFEARPGPPHPSFMDEDRQNPSRGFPMMENGRNPSFVGSAERPTRSNQPFSVVLSILPALLFFSVSSGLAAALRLYSGLNEETRRRQELETEFLRHELIYLRLQLGPHFLFNTLNNIYSLVEVDAARAQGALLDLGDLLRYQLYETEAPQVPLAAEIAFLRSYVALMELRLPEHARVHFTVQPEIVKCSIAPLLFLPLVENAFKHGIHPTRQSSISIHLLQEGAGILLSVRNTSFPKGESHRIGSGIGIANLRKRLALLYDGDHRFTSQKSDGEYACKLWIGCKEAAA
ncbi:MAG: histidine kinase [Fibrobacterota bacterium]